MRTRYGYCFAVSSCDKIPSSGGDPYKVKDFLVGMSIETGKVVGQTPIGQDNLLTVLAGAKEVLLYSPWQFLELHPQMEPNARWKSAARSRGYAAAGGAGAYAGLVDVPCWRAELKAGESLYIPTVHGATFTPLHLQAHLHAQLHTHHHAQGWWHEVLTPTVTLALNFWFKPHPRAALRPTILHLHSDAYARRAGVKRRHESLARPV